MRLPWLVIDATGVGRPVRDMFTQAGLAHIAVTISGGHTAHVEDGMWLVPKRILVATLQVLLQSERFKFAEQLPEASTLIKEMLAFQVTLTEAANDTYAGRQGAHDDLMLSVALAAWWGERDKPVEAVKSKVRRGLWIGGQPVERSW